MAIKDVGRNANFRITNETITLDEIRQLPSVTVRNPVNKQIEKMVFPSDVEVGNKKNSNLKSNISVAGSISLANDSFITFGETVGVNSYGIRASGGNIQFKNVGGSWADIPGSSGGGSGDITGVTAGNGITGGGTSGTVTVTVEASDSTISVGASGISVDESNLSSIPNGALSNSSITIAGSAVSLGGSITADTIAGQISSDTITNAQLDNSTISGVSLGSNLNNLTIGNGVQLNSGTTYNGSSAVTLSIQNSDSTISVGSGGISVDESNLSSIPNSALSNSTISGVSLGSNLPNLTVSNGLSGSVGTYNGSVAVTVAVSGSDGTISVNQHGVSVGTITSSKVSDFQSSVRSNISVTDSGGAGSCSYNSSTGVVTYVGASKADLDVDHIITLTGVSAASDNLGTFTGSTIANNETIKGALQDLETELETKASSAQGGTISFIVDSQKPLAGAFETAKTVIWDNQAATNASVGSNSNGEITIASTGTYRVSAFASLVADSVNQRSNVRLQVEQTDGSNTTGNYISQVCYSCRHTSKTRNTKCLLYFYRCFYEKDKFKNTIKRW